MKKELAMQSSRLPLPAGCNAIGLDEGLMVLDNMDRMAVGDEMAAGLEWSSRFPLKSASACVLVVKSGMVRFSVNFRDCVVTDGMCALIAPGTIIEHVEWNDDTRLFFLTFSQHELHPSSMLAGIFVARPVVVLKLLPVQVELFETGYGILRSILSEPALAAHRSECAFDCVNMLGSIITQEADDLAPGTAKVSRRDEIVDLFLQRVQENYRSHRELGFYADLLGLSLKYMSHVIFEQTGRHPSQWIKDYVILDAKTMLRSGRYSIQQVAEELHFPNQSFFGKYFKEAVGVSPKKWMK